MYYNNRTKVASGGSMVETDSSSAGKAVQLDALWGNVLCTRKIADRMQVSSGMSLGRMYA